MQIRKAFKCRLDPTADQKQALASQCGHARFVYNWALARRQAPYQGTGKGLKALSINNELKDLKNAPETIWLKQAARQPLQQKSKDLDTAYKNFFEGRAKSPKFKARRAKQAIRDRQRFQVEGQRVDLPKVGWVKAVIPSPRAGEMKNGTVSKTKSGKYCVSMQCAIEIAEPKFEGGPIGVDLGFKDFAVLSDGEKIDNPKWLRASEKKLARWNRQLSGKVKGSEHWNKARIRLARQHEKGTNPRKAVPHKLSQRLVDENPVIRLENLKVQGLVRNPKLAKSISDAGWSEFVRQAEDQGAWSGGPVEKINRFFPASKTGAECKAVNQDLTRSDRTWLWTECGVVHDRDINAAINILTQGTGGTTETITPVAIG